MTFQMRFFVVKTRRKTTIFKIYAFDFLSKLARLDMFLCAQTPHTNDIICLECHHMGPEQVCSKSASKSIGKFSGLGTFPTYGWLRLTDLKWKGFNFWYIIFRFGDISLCITCLKDKKSLSQSNCDNII